VTRSLVLAVLLTAAAGVAQAATGTYKAQRFDVVVRAANGGVDVAETVTFEFQSGTFTKVWRDIPISRTDGITILDAAMDGAAMTPGEAPGHIAVSSRNGNVRVEWRFAQVGPSVHRFDVHHAAKGVAYRDGDSDVVRWRALPEGPRYRIDASRIRFEPAGAQVRTPESHRVAAVTLKTSNEGTTIEASAIQSDGWIVAELRYPAGLLAPAEPEWRQRASRAREIAPNWAIGGAVTLVAGLFLVVVSWQRYPAPAGPPGETATTEPPQPLPAALAAALTARGGVSAYQSIATILDLADRGVLRVLEVSRRLGVRSYVLSQVPGKHDVEPHEAEALAIAFAERGDDVTLSNARARLTRRARRMGATISADLAARGLIDPDRKAARDHLAKIALLMFPAAALVAFAVAPLIPSYQGWPLLVPLGLLIAGIAGLVMAASMTPLSDQGLVEAARWRGFKRHLKSLAARDDESATRVPARWIVYAVAVGIGREWSRYLKGHPDVAPPWFVAAGSDPGHSFAMFVGGHAASGADGGAGAAGGAAAGGGGSGAG